MKALLLVLLLIFLYIPATLSDVLHLSQTGVTQQLWFPTVDQAIQSSLEHHLAKDWSWEGLKVHQVGPYEDILWTTQKHVSLEFEIQLVPKESSKQKTFLSYDYNFVLDNNDTQWKHLWGIPSEMNETINSAVLVERSSLSTNFPLQPTSLSDISLIGPLELYCSTPDVLFEDISLESNTLRMERGTQLTISGAKQIELREPILFSLQQIENNVLVIWNNIPKLSIEANELILQSEEKTIQIEQGKKMVHLKAIMIPDPPNTAKFSFPLNDKNFQRFQLEILGLEQKLSQRIRINKLASAKIEAIISYKIPIRMSSEHRNFIMADVIVAQNREGLSRVVQLEEEKVKNFISYSQAAANNGSYLEPLQSILSSANM